MKPVSVGQPPVATSASRPELCVGAVVVCAGSLLLVRRGQPPGVGLWSIPGGRVERGETMGQAVERETFEETGVKVQTGRLVGWVERIVDHDTDSDYHFVIFDFEATVAPSRLSAPCDGPPTLVSGDDASEAAWVPLHSVFARQLVPGLAQFLTEHGVVC